MACMFVDAGAFTGHWLATATSSGFAIPALSRYITTFLSV
jgi:hypothetical protein